MAFLNEVGDRQAIMAEAHGDSHDEAHMRMSELMKSVLVLVVAPANREITLLATLQERS